MIFTSSIEEEPMSKFANRLREAIRNASYIYDGAHIPVTASFGTVEIRPGDTFGQAVLAVDEAMYQAKRGGRNRVIAGEIKKK